MPFLGGAPGILSPPHGIPARANAPSRLGSLGWFETPNFAWVCLSPHQSRPHPRCQEAQGVSLPNCASVSLSVDGLSAMLRLPMAGLISKGLLAPPRLPQRQLREAKFTLGGDAHPGPRGVGGVVPRDTQGAQCPRMPPALLSPPDAEKTLNYWNEGARRRLELALALQPAARRAKNIVLFVGDGESPRSQPGPTDPQQPGDVAGEKMGLVQVPFSPSSPGQCLGRAGLSLVLAPCHPVALPCPQAWGCPRCRRLGSTRGSWLAAWARRVSWPWRPFPMWPWPR